MQAQSQSEIRPTGATRDRIPWGWVALTVVGLEIALIGSAFAWVAIYAYLLNPGQDPAYYETYARFSGPIVSVAVGVPYLFLACRWAGRKAGMRAAAMSLSVWLVLVTIDVLLILLSGGLTVYLGTMVLISHATKLLGAYLGGRAALKDVINIRQVGAGSS